MADDFSNWDEEEGGEGGDDQYYDDGTGGGDDGGDYTEDGGVEYDATGTIEEEEEGELGEEEELYAAGDEEYVPNEDDQNYDEDGEYIGEEDDGTHTGEGVEFEDDQTYDDDGGDGGEEMGGEEDPHAGTAFAGMRNDNEDEMKGPDLEQEIKMSALEAARNKALKGRSFSLRTTSSPALAATPSAFGNLPKSTFGGTAPINSAFTLDPAFLSGGKATSFGGAASAFGGGNSNKTSSFSAFGGAPAAATSTTSAFSANASSFKVTTTPAATSSFAPQTIATTTKPNKKDKKEKNKKNKKGGGNSEDNSLDASPDTLNSRSKRFSNMVAPSPSAFDDMNEEVSPSPSPPVGGRSTASLMAAAMGGMDGSPDVGDEGELYTAQNFRAIVGQCLLMCPLEEQQARQESRDLSYFEIIPGTGSKDHGDVPLVDPHKAVKKYKRAAAAQTLHAKDVRPPHILKQTMDYLVTQIMDRKDSPDPPPIPSFLVIYRFVSDRMRALRQDFVCQMQKDTVAIRCYEIMVRFHILTMFELGDLNNLEKFDPTPNMEKLSQTLTSLRHMFHDNYLNQVTSHTGFPTPNEAEMHSYRLLMELDRRFGTLYEELDKFDPAVKNSPIIQFCVQVYNAFRENNYARFFHLARQAPYFHAILLQGYFNKVRARALEVMCQSYHTYPFEDFEELLGFESADHTQDFLEFHGIDHEFGQPTIHFKKDSFYQPETVFPFRNSFKIIADKRPPKISQAVLQEVGRGEGLGLDIGSIRAGMSASSSALVRTRAMTSTQPMQTSNLASSQSTKKTIVPTPVSSTSGPTSSAFISPSLFTGSTTASTGASAFGAPPASSFGLPPASVLENLNSKPTKLNRASVTPTLSTTTSFAPTPSAVPPSSLNPKATPFVPTTPVTSTHSLVGLPTGATANTTAKASTSAFDASSFASNTASSSTTTSAFSTSSASIFGPTASSTTTMSASSFAPPALNLSKQPSSTPQVLTPKVSTPKGLPPPSFASFAGFNATTSTTTSTTSTSSKPPTPVMNATKPPTPVSHIAGFQLPVASQPNSIGSFPPIMPPVMMKDVMPPPPASQQVQPKSSDSLQPHPRPPMQHAFDERSMRITVSPPTASVAPQPIAKVASPPKPPPAPVRPPSPTQSEEYDMFLQAYHHYRHLLPTRYLTRWLARAREKRQASQRLEAMADAFLLTKFFLRWHDRYAQSYEYRQRFEAAKQTLHSPVSYVLQSPTKARTSGSAFGSPSKALVFQSPAKNQLVPFNSQFVSATPAGTPLFLSPLTAVSTVGAGLISPYQKLANMGVEYPNLMEVDTEEQEQTLDQDEAHSLPDDQEELFPEDEYHELDQADEEYHEEEIPDEQEEVQHDDPYQGGEDQEEEKGEHEYEHKYDDENQPLEEDVGDEQVDEDAGQVEDEEEVGDEDHPFDGTEEDQNEEVEVEEDTAQPDEYVEGDELPADEYDGGQEEMTGEETEIGGEENEHQEGDQEEYQEDDHDGTGEGQEFNGEEGDEEYDDEHADGDDQPVDEEPVEEEKVPTTEAEPDQSQKPSVFSQPTTSPISAFQLSSSFHSPSAFQSSVVDQRSSSSAFTSPTPHKSGVKRKSFAVVGSTSNESTTATSSFTSPARRSTLTSSTHLTTPTQQPASIFPTHTSFMYDESDGEEEKENNNNHNYHQQQPTNKPKLFHTPSRLVPQAVFSPNSSGDLLQQLKAEMAETSRLNELMEQLENQFRY